MGLAVTGNSQLGPQRRVLLVRRNPNLEVGRCGHQVIQRLGELAYDAWLCGRVASRANYFGATVSPCVPLPWKSPFMSVAFRSFSGVLQFSIAEQNSFDRERPSNFVRR